mmetsp:Transcript_107787/g.313737  ORF Transcript_107787/g.313737 Transcript_107787/m.313737 type:complete len:269 (-) Transcript_107787:61-867(-)
MRTLPSRWATAPCAMAVIGLVGNERAPKSATALVVHSRDEMMTGRALRLPPATSAATRPATKPGEVASARAVSKLEAISLSLRSPSFGTPTCLITAAAAVRLKPIEVVVATSSAASAQAVSAARTALITFTFDSFHCFDLAAQITTSASEKPVLASPTGTVGAAGAEAGSALIAANLAAMAANEACLSCHLTLSNPAVTSAQFSKPRVSMVARAESMSRATESDTSAPSSSAAAAAAAVLEFDGAPPPPPPLLPYQYWCRPRLARCRR